MLEDMDYYCPRNEAEYKKREEAHYAQRQLDYDAAYNREYEKHVYEWYRNNGY